MFCFCLFDFFLGFCFGFFFLKKSKGIKNLEGDALSDAVQVASVKELKLKYSTNILN